MLASAASADYSSQLTGKVGLIIVAVKRSRGKT